MTLWIYSPWNSPGQNTGVGSHSLLQGIFPTQELNLGLPHCRRILYQLSHQGSPRILEWEAFPFFSRYSQPRDRIRVSFIAGRFFTSRPTRETQVLENLPEFLETPAKVLAGWMTFLDLVPKTIVVSSRTAIKYLLVQLC